MLNTHNTHNVTEQEGKVLVQLAKVIPKLTEDQLNHLLWFGEGVAFATEQQQTFQGQDNRHSSGGQA